ncbi:transmembrane protein 135 [Striga asiatica]|uniref:Transmembrane protein 135 n=1 Tax=Striga asiatica TaxID=4170 RepID=A0A5A7P5D8_STRAF|nr:transmembrane protein 135 [Striga asiatica]
MSKNGLNLIMTLLVLSILVSRIAPSTSDDTHLGHGTQATKRQINEAKSIPRESIGMEKLKVFLGRMNVEIDDYPGSGPNNRHDPNHQNCCKNYRGHCVKYC